MGRRIGNSYNQWLGFGKGSIVDEVRVVNVRRGSGRWASGGHDDE